MAKKRLEGEALREFEKLVLAEKTPEDIARHFDIAVSSVHNYKRAMKERGIEIPNVRGKRPQGFAPRPVMPRFVRGDYPTEATQNDSTSYGSGFIEFLVDGKPIMVPKNVKSIKMENNQVILEY